MVGIKIFLYGLDNAGKTALSETIKLGKTFENTKPTLTTIMSKTVISNITFVIWDVPGQVSLRKNWKEDLFKSRLLIFVLDTADKERFEEAKKEFIDILNNLETSRLPLIFCFHKMDLTGAINNLQEAKDKFQLNSITERKTVIQETSIKEMNTIVKLKEKMVSILLG